MRERRIVAACRSRALALGGAMAVAAAALVAPVGASGVQSQPGHFKTPSGNIVCISWLGAPYGPSVGCRIKSGLMPKPPVRSGCWKPNDIGLKATGRAWVGGRTICPGDDEGDAGPLAYEQVARVLAYGRTLRVGGIRCTSAITGLTCRNRGGHGFFLSRERWRKF